MSEEKFPALPYVHHLEGRDAVDVLAATPGRLDALLAPMSPEQVEFRPGPGKWNVREIVAHMADCEIAWAWRFRLTYGADRPTLQPFEQDPWAKAYANTTLEQAKVTFETLRAWNLMLLRGLSDAEKQRPAFHPERGELTLWNIAEIAAGHDLHHLHSLEKL